MNPSHPFVPLLDPLTEIESLSAVTGWLPTSDHDRIWWLHEPHAPPVRLGFSEEYGIVQRVHLQPYNHSQDEYLYLADIETGERGWLPHYPPHTVFAVTALDGLCYGMCFNTFIAADVVAFATHTACLPALVQRFGRYTPIASVTQEPVTIRWCWWHPVQTPR